MRRSITVARPIFTRCSWVTTNNKQTECLQTIPSSSWCKTSDRQLHIGQRRPTVEAAALKNEEVKPFEEIPGPRALPIIGSGWAFLPHIGEFSGLGAIEMHQLIYEKYGPIARFSGFPGRAHMVVIFRPEDVETVFRNEGPWPMRLGNQGMQYYRTVTRKDFYKESAGVLAENGVKWAEERTKVNPPMMQPRISKQYMEPIGGVAQDFIERIRSIKNEKDELPPDFVNDLFKWSLESIAYVALDARLGCLAPNLSPDSEPQKMINAVGDFFDCMFPLEVEVPFWKIFPTPTWKRFARALDTFLEVSVKHVNAAMEHQKKRKAEGMESNAERSVLERLLMRMDAREATVMAQDMMFGGIDTHGEIPVVSLRSHCVWSFVVLAPNPEAPKRDNYWKFMSLMAERVIRDYCTETSYAMAAVLYLMTKNQDKQELLFRELKQHLPSKDDIITEEKLEAMKYLKACLKESLRIIPIVPGNFRVAVKDLFLSNYRVPPGTNIIMPSIKSITSEELFPQNKRYIPERWLKTRPTEKTAGCAEDFDAVNITKRHPFAFLPFGFGPRSCVGRRFAELETEILLAKIVRNFKVEYNYGEINFVNKILTTPKEPLQFKMTEREG